MFVGLDENIATKANHAQVIEGNKRRRKVSFMQINTRTIHPGEMKHALLDGDVANYDLVRFENVDLRRMNASFLLGPWLYPTSD